MNFIVAVDEKYGIAKNGNLLAYLPNDLQFFKEKTLHHVVIMGRKTLESLPKKKPLPNRTTIVLTRNQDYRVDGAIVLHSLEEVLTWLKQKQISQEQIFISGGAEIYHLFLPYCNKGYLTKIHHDFSADCHIEKIEENKEWIEEYRSTKQEEQGYCYEWITYIRQKK